MNGIFTNTINGIFRKEQDKAAAEYVLNPETHPENTETFEESLDRKKMELDRMELELELEVAEIQHKKLSRIKKSKAKTRTLREWFLVLKTIFSRKFEQHKAIFAISVLLFIASSFIHAKSFQVFLGIFLPDVWPALLLTVSILISLALEGLGTALYEEYNDGLAHGIYFVSLSVIVGMGVYQYSLGQSVSVAVWRTALGCITLAGLYASHAAMRKKEFWASRKDFNSLPRTYRKEINSLLEKLLSEHRSGNAEYRLNFKDMLKTYNLKSASFEKLLVRKGVRQKKFFQELPARRREKKKSVTSSPARKQAKTA